eukprot:TRINITY_DN7079_c0_g1_i2.p1 TRINITY_DN7079_c0_g1~~TRINITY_DN7079_c0_g1_i2.p1  ORF type:complete len:595 (+),score=108.83 TRINITY_DN7079_c0_g1_i2:112-1896(+)
MKRKPQPLTKLESRSDLLLETIQSEGEDTFHLPPAGQKNSGVAQSPHKEASTTKLPPLRPKNKPPEPSTFGDYIALTHSDVDEAAKQKWEARREMILAQLEAQERRNVLQSAIDASGPVHHTTTLGALEHRLSLLRTSPDLQKELTAVVTAHSRRSMAQRRLQALEGVPNAIQANKLRLRDLSPDVRVQSTLQTARQHSHHVMMVKEEAKRRKEERMQQKYAAVQQTESRQQFVEMLLQEGFYRGNASPDMWHNRLATGWLTVVAAALSSQAFGGLLYHCREVEAHNKLSQPQKEIVRKMWAQAKAVCMCKALLHRLRNRGEGTRDQIRAVTLLKRALQDTAVSTHFVRAAKVFRRQVIAAQRAVRMFKQMRSALLVLLELQWERTLVKMIQKLRKKIPSNSEQLEAARKAEKRLQPVKTEVDPRAAVMIINAEISELHQIPKSVRQATLISNIRDRQHAYLHELRTYQADLNNYTERVSATKQDYRIALGLLPQIGHPPKPPHFQRVMPESDMQELILEALQRARFSHRRATVSQLAPTSSVGPALLSSTIGRKRRLADLPRKSSMVRAKSIDESDGSETQSMQEALTARTET